MRRILPLLLVSSAAWSCGSGSSSGSDPIAPPTGAGNVLVILLDDVGVDKVAVYGEHPAPAKTKNLDRLAEEGLLFRRAYVQPWCSPTRACLLTGRYGFRTGVGNPISQNVVDYEMPLEEVTLPELLRAGSNGRIESALIGKWHLTSFVLGHVLNPNEQGFDWYEGVFGNFAGDGYFQHEKVTNGLVSTSTEYATTEQVDDALRRTRSMSEPWFLEVAFSAAHQPFHAPPAYLHTQTLSGDPNHSKSQHVAAMIEAMDHEIGRLLANIDHDVLARTTVFVLGDNGTDPDVMDPPWPVSGKGTLLEGGVRVPLIVWGNEVGDPGREEHGFVHAVDLFPTIAELLGVDVATAMPDQRAIDGLSFASTIRSAGAPTQRKLVYSDVFSPNGFGPYIAGKRMIRDSRWKLIHHITTGEDELYDLQDITIEGPNLLLAGLDAEQQAAYDALLQQLQQLTSSP
jgi:arylsulfatase A-like enzyme